MLLRYFSRWLVRPEDLVTFDPARGFTAPRDRLVARLVFGAAVSLFGMVPLRVLIDQFSVTAGPYALIYPTVVVATVFGRREAGLAALATSFVWALASNIETHSWYTLPIPVEPGRMLVNLASAGVVVLLTDLFRSVAERALIERDQEIAHRKLLALEIEHRTKNNFAMVSSLLHLQRRRESNDDTINALSSAINRIQSFAGAYADLSVRDGGAAETDMPAYLRDLLDRVGSAAFDEKVTVTLVCDALVLPRETAVAIGLFVNEALTNCAKYAFANVEAGSIAVHLKGSTRSWRCTIEDDGSGLTERAEQGAGAGLGTGLMEAFARQASAEIERPATAKGYAIALVYTEKP